MITTTAVIVAHRLVVSANPTLGDTTMTATSNLSSTLVQLKELATNLPGAMRTSVEHMIQQCMESEVSEQIGAKHQQRSAERESHRNGYRHRALDTQLGKLDIRIPRLRSGSYYPSFLEPRCRLHESLCAVVMEAYEQGISTRKIDDLAQALGMEGISKSAASRMITALNADVQTFCSRPLGECPYVFMDARFEKVRENGRIISKAVLVAVGVTTAGQRELLGFTVAAGEDTDTWDHFLRSLVERGLHGVKLAISDACAGAAKAIQQVLPGASWQRCTIHLARNLAAAVSYKHRAEVSALLKLILTSADLPTARKNLAHVLRILDERHPKAAKILEEAGEDMLAFLHFPSVHWRKIHSTNLVERLNREIKRRTRVVSIFPSETSLTHLVGCILERTYLTWASERYMSTDSMRLIDTTDQRHGAA
jgi:putative transposase